MWCPFKDVCLITMDCWYVVQEKVHKCPKFWRLQHTMDSEELQTADKRQKAIEKG